MKSYRVVWFRRICSSCSFLKSEVSQVRSPDVLGAAAAAGVTEPKGVVDRKTSYVRTLPSFDVWPRSNTNNFTPGPEGSVTTDSDVVRPVSITTMVVDMKDTFKDVCQGDVCNILRPMAVTTSAWSLSQVFVAELHTEHTCLIRLAAAVTVVTFLVLTPVVPTATETDADPKGTDVVSTVHVVATSVAPPGCPTEAPMAIPAEGVETAAPGITSESTHTPWVALRGVSLPVLSIPGVYSLRNKDDTSAERPFGKSAPLIAANTGATIEVVRATEVRGAAGILFTGGLFFFFVVLLLWARA